MDEPLARLPLHQRHAEHGARFAPFAGFEMPVRYGSIIEEHRTVRQKVGLFDVSHMGEVELVGPRAGEAIDHIVTNDVGKLSDGEALYTVMCHPHGGIVDDLLVYRLATDHYLAVVNASNRAKDFAHIREAASDRCEVLQKSDDYCQLAVQGPRAEAVLQPITDLDLSTLSGFQFVVGDVGGVRTLVARTGYTGEDGFELYAASGDAVPLFDAVWAAGRGDEMRLCGLGARDTLRLEARYMLYGNDITDETTPLEAGLGWLVKFDKGDFIGREALLAQKADGLKRRLRGLILKDRGVLRAGYPILVGDQVVGQTTSGGPSPTLGGSIGLGYIAVEHLKRREVEVDVRGRRLRCEMTRKPFYRRGD
jgi:aminomethyltransferase